MLDFRISRRPFHQQKMFKRKLLSVWLSGVFICAPVCDEMSPHLPPNRLQVNMFAPNIDQMHVVNHLKGEPSEEKRNVLVESARLARGNIQDLSKLSVKEHDAVIFPGWDSEAPWPFNH